MREVETGLGAYQEIAATRNERDVLTKELAQMRKRLFHLEDAKRGLTKVDVMMGGRSFQLYIDLRKAPEPRQGDLVICYVERLVNPPFTDRDKELAAKEETVLAREISHRQFLLMCSILDKNVFYTDKLFYAMSLPTMGGETLQDLEARLRRKKEEFHALYRQYMEDQNKAHAAFQQWSKEMRGIYQMYWGQYFRLHPPDLVQIQNASAHYSSVIEKNRKSLLDAMWEKKNVSSRFHSNKQYVYNLDDHQLYPLRGTTIGPEVLPILEREEGRWQVLIQAQQEEITRLLPVYDDLHDRHKAVSRRLRLLERNKTVSGNYILSCLQEGCLGKLDDNGWCALCQHRFCLDCRKEKEDGHTCQEEDVQTIRELQKTTRPCPKCSVPISKTEGCDQMWCVRCHTTFSWKTGAISQGVVHNPHFYQQRQQAMRTPGDIPCGGLPNEVEVLLAIARSGGSLMYNLWDYCDRIAEEYMPRIYQKFHNVRPARYRRYSIAYMRGKINKKQLGSCLYRTYLDETRYAYYYAILETFVDNMAEYMRQFVQGSNTEKECRALLAILEHDVAQMNKIFHMKEDVRAPI